MASFGHFLGRKVTVVYRVGDVLLPASGTLAADSGRSIFLEQHLEQKGKRSYFRWEIPYQFIHKLEAVEETQQEPMPSPAAQKSEAAEQENSRAAAASAACGLSPASTTPPMYLPQRPKTA
jgi:hypothetical protein